MKSAAGRQSVGKPAEAANVVRFVCRCGRSLKASARMAGHGSHCRGCGADVVVPERAQNHRIVFASLPDDSPPTDRGSSAGQPSADDRQIHGARVNDTATLSMSPTLADIDMPAHNPNT